MALAYDLDTLRSQIRSLTPDVLNSLAKQYAKEHGGDETAFVLWLHDEGHIAAGELRDCIASLDVTFAESVPTEAPIERHRVLGLLGRGAMGEVFVARDEDLRRNVAFKRMFAHLAADPTLARRFVTEIQVTAQLDHPAIVPVYGIERGARGVEGYTMKLVRGRTLKEFILEARKYAEQGQLPPDSLSLHARVELFLQFCEPVGYAHSRGVIHRDLKPDNIMVGPFGEVFVMDWGIARLIGGPEPLSEGQAADAEKTAFGVVIGTTSYMAPEQAEGRNEDMDGRSDLFSLGLILFEMSTLRRARPGAKGAEALIAAQAGKVDPVLALSKREPVPRELAAIIRKATQKRRRDRYQTMQLLADDVRRFLRGEAVQAQSDTAMQRFARWIGKHRDTSAAIGLALVLFVFVIIGVTATGSFVALEVSRDAASRRERQLSTVIAAVSSQARLMDRQFQRYEGLLHGLAFTAEKVLTTDPGTQAYYLQAAYETPGQGPADLAETAVYGPASLDAIDLALAPGAVSATFDLRLRQLASLQPYFLRVLLQSVEEDAVALAPAEQRKLILETGAPVVWTYVALEEGILGALPGTGVYPINYDPRTRPWYANARGHRLPHWGSVYLDESGMGLLLDCGTGLYDSSGRFLGVAALDITVGYLVDSLLDPTGLPAKTEAYLVDQDGKIVVQSSLKEAAKTGKDYHAGPLPFSQVLTAINAGSTSGHLKVADKLMVWTRLDAVPWTYLVVGRADELVPG